jgi:glycosyltransferase involved in cell wall biosynthesis
MQRAFLDTGVLSLDPLVTYTKRHRPTPLGLAGACPELFTGRKSLNFVAPCWSYYQGDFSEIAREWRRTMARLPDAMIVALASTDREAAQLSSAGVPTVICNGSIFVDETVFKPLEPFDFSDAVYEAIYNARFEPYKRHELARAIDSLALIYDARFDGKPSPLEASIREMLGGARYLNHLHGRGRYQALSNMAVARELNRARAGLCLSASEGIMRSSMEYLLCGIPVVSTHSVGGRDRYYQEPYAILVADDADAVRDAVLTLKRRQLNKLAIREHVGRLVEFERKNFLVAVNEIAESHLGARSLFTSLAPFVKAEPYTEPQHDWSRKKIQRVADALGVSLQPRAKAAAPLTA